MTKTYFDKPKKVICNTAISNKFWNNSRVYDYVATDQDGNYYIIDNTKTERRIFKVIAEHDNGFKAIENEL